MGFRLPHFHRNFRRNLRRTLWFLLAFVLVAAFVHEVRTSAIQSWFFSGWARKLVYRVEPGPSPSIVFPEGGPFDVRSGYTEIPDFVQRLESRGFKVTAQARFSPELERMARWGVVPPFWGPASTDLAIRGLNGASLFHGPAFDAGYKSFQDVPQLVTKALLLIENRELEEPSDSRTNPVVDWGRLAKASLLYSGRKLGLPLRVEGGSTLATQMEKYRHSSRGRTQSVFAKIQQMAAASLKVYKEGPDTRSTRQEIVVRYLNTVPLSAAPGYGEVFGIDAGLYAWFGDEFEQINADLNSPGLTDAKVTSLKKVMALLCAVRAPSYYLMENNAALWERVNYYTRLLAKVGIISNEFSQRLQACPIAVSGRPMPAESHDRSFSRRKAADAIRTNLIESLHVHGYYELDRLHLDVDSSIDVQLQRKVEGVFQSLQDRAFLAKNNLIGEHLFGDEDPSKVIYGLTLYERTPAGNFLRVEADNFNGPFDINEGMKLQLGSTAKLRTLCHYLEIVASLHDQYADMTEEQLKNEVTQARDPITKWAAQTLMSEKVDLETFTQQALDRKYSANPGEAFFTGGGAHVFRNFEREDNGRILTVREAIQRSVNLVFIRLMRDLVRYHISRLPYNPDAVLNDVKDPVRTKMLEQIADDEARDFLRSAFEKFENLSGDLITSKLLGTKATSIRYLSILFFAWNHNGTPDGLEDWLRPWLGKVTPEQIRAMMKAYGNPALNLSDFAYLLGVHPLDLWCAGEFRNNPSLSWNDLWEKSEQARRISSAWLFKTRNRAAQDLRLRIRIEQDAFQRMTPYWQRLGFPFDRLVPSYATAIGSSGDRPAALAKLMGVIVNEGMMMPSYRISRLNFARGTPYETVMEPQTTAQRVLPAVVANAVRDVLVGTVEIGTARRVAGAYKLPDGTPVIVGGKTGSGDNRFESFGRHHQLLSARPVNRTAVFVFYIGGRYFGALTAFVPGAIAGNYRFTSSLPVGVVKLLAPALSDRLGGDKTNLLVYNRIQHKARMARPTGTQVGLATTSTSPNPRAISSSEISAVGVPLGTMMGPLDPSRLLEPRTPRSAAPVDIKATALVDSVLSLPAVAGAPRPYVAPSDRPTPKRRFPPREDQPVSPPLASRGSTGRGRVMQKQLRPLQFRTGQ